jgi:hypothetical protein
MATTTYYMSAISLIVQYLNNLGIIGPNCVLNTYVGGSVGTPVPTYTDSTGTVPNPNPMTLNSAGRPATIGGAPTAFWVPGGVSVQLVVTDAGGTQLVFLDNVPAINDLTNVNNALQALLASAASSNGAGSGPVAGVDLVANAVKSYDVIADVRAANAPTLVSGQTLNIELQGGSAPGDGLGGFFYWSPTSVAVDDGRTVLKPTTAGATGRWLRYYALNTPLVLVRTNDQQVLNSTVLVNDNTLTAALATGTYLVSLRLILIGIGGTGQGYKVQPTFAGTVVSVSQGTAVRTGNGAIAADQALLNTSTGVAAISSTTGDAYNADFVLQVNGAGAFTVQFAQNAGSANATVMKAGSSLLVTRVA